MPRLVPQTVFSASATAAANSAAAANAKVPVSSGINRLYQLQLYNKLARKIAIANLGGPDEKKERKEKY